MKKRFFSILLSLCMVLALLPVTAFAEDNEEPTETPVCTCDTACSAETMNTDCPICGVEGATAENCGKYEAPVEETEPEQTAVEKVQAMLDALPDADTITEENRADVEAQLTAIDEAKFPLGDELDALDFTRYNAAIAVLNELDGMGGAEVPETLEDTLQGSGTEADPWILTKAILDSKFSYSSLGGTSYKLNSGMYRLGEDITVTDGIQITDATVTLDLNGYKLLSTGSATMLYVVQDTVGATSRLTLVDGSSGKTGEVRSNTGKVVCTNLNTEFDGNSVPIYGTVDNKGAISGGVFHGDVSGNSSDATITGGVFYGAVNADTRINDSAKVTVSFSSDGWTGTQKVLKGQKASTPARDGCTCTGCYTDSTYTTAFDFDTAITADTTLYAKWVCAGHTGGTATCRDKAVCDYCGKLYGELNGSTHAGGTEVRNAKDAKCTEDGYTGDTYCKGCDMKLQDGKPITKLGHIDADKNHVCDREYCKATLSTCSGGTATCKDKAVCDYCGEPYGEVDSGNHAGGTEVRNAKDATCTEDGYTGDTYCKGCETKLSSGKSVDKTRHDYESKVTKEATTTNTGTKTYTCKNCGHSYEEEIAKLPSQSTSPQTGDNSHMALWFALILLSGGALAGTAVYGKKRKHSAK